MSWHEWAMDANMYDGDGNDFEPETICPFCNEVTYVATNEEEIECPNCGKMFDPFPEPDEYPDLPSPMDSSL